MTDPKRRDFLSLSGAMVAAAALPVQPAAAQETPNQASTSGPLPQDPPPYDVVIVGAGLGGISAAVRAAEAGKRVALLEARDVLGGTAAFSGGGVHIWSAQTWEAYRKTCPLADPVLAKALFDGFEPYARWLEQLKAPGAYETSTVRGLTLTKYQIGYTISPIDRVDWFTFMGQALERLGGTIYRNTRARRLVQDNGKVVGVVAEQHGRNLTLQAGAVILAAGGFQSNPDLLTKYVGANALSAISRAVGTDIGDGLTLALEAGAATSPSMNTVYGHLMPAPPCEISWTNGIDPLLMSGFYAEHGLVVNIKGERFVDEGDGELTGVTINAAVQQPPGGLWVVMDDRIRRDHGRYEIDPRVLQPHNLRYAPFMRYWSLAWRDGSPTLLMDSFGLAQDRGAVVLKSETLRGLADALQQHGVSGEGLMATIAAFNADVRDGKAAGLPIPKMKSAHPMHTAPYWAIKVTPGISMTYGGVAINAQAEALDSTGAPIPGLYAVPGTAGGVHVLHYAGALAACGVYGMIAADRIVKA